MEEEGRLTALFVGTTYFDGQLAVLATFLDARNPPLRGEGGLYFEWLSRNSPTASGMKALALKA